MLGRLSEIAQLLDPQAAMRNGSLAQALSAGIDQTNLMALARPVDAYKPFNLFRHAQALLSHHTSGPPERASIPVLALEAQPPTGLPSRPTCRGAGPLQVLKTRRFSGNSRHAGPVCKSRSAAHSECRVLAATRNPVADPMPAETMFPLSELDRMLPLSDTALHTAAGSERGRRSSRPSVSSREREQF